MDLKRETSTVVGSQRSARPVRRFFRFALLGYAWLFLAAVLLEVYFAGLMLWEQRGGRGLHEDAGWILVGAAALFLVLPAVARAGVATVVVGGVLALITLAQPLLAMVEDSRLIAALHPVNAVLMVVLPIVLIRRGMGLVRQEREAVRSR